MFDIIPFGVWSGPKWFVMVSSLWPSDGHSILRRQKHLRRNHTQQTPVGANPLISCLSQFSLFNTIRLELWNTFLSGKLLAVVIYYTPFKSHLKLKYREILHDHKPFLTLRIVLNKEYSTYITVCNFETFWQIRSCHGRTRCREVSFLDQGRVRYPPETHIKLQPYEISFAHDFLLG